MHFNENKNTTLEKAHKTQNGHFYEREKNRKKARQAMVEQNLRNDRKVIKSRFNIGDQLQRVGKDVILLCLCLFFYLSLFLYLSFFLTL